MTENTLPPAPYQIPDVPGIRHNPPKLSTDRTRERTLLIWKTWVSTLQEALMAAVAPAFVDAAGAGLCDSAGTMWVHLPQEDPAVAERFAWAVAGCGKTLDAVVTMGATTPEQALMYYLTGQIRALTLHSPVTHIRTVVSSCDVLVQHLMEADRSWYSAPVPEGPK